MFAYCGNNPVNMTDQFGCSCVATPVEYSAPFVDIVIYYHHPDSTKNMDDAALSQTYSEHAFFVPVDSFGKFVSLLKNLPENTRDVYCYLHGDPNDLAFYHVTYDGEAISDGVPEISIDGYLYLFVCHGLTVADEFAKATTCKVIATNQGVSFSGGRARISPWDLAKDAAKFKPVFWHIASPDGSTEIYSLSVFCW